MKKDLSSVDLAIILKDVSLVDLLIIYDHIINGNSYKVTGSKIGWSYENIRLHYSAALRKILRNIERYNEDTRGR